MKEREGKRKKRKTKRKTGEERTVTWLLEGFSARDGDVISPFLCSSPFVSVAASSSLACLSLVLFVLRFALLCGGHSERCVVVVLAAGGNEEEDKEVSETKTEEGDHARLVVVVDVCG